ncbi:hypothetical protein D9M70_631560 [compost metagenome]
MFGHRHHEAVLAATDAVDADHIGAKVGQERTAERPRDVAPEIKYPYAFKNLRHDSFTQLVFHCSFVR